MGCSVVYGRSSLSTQPGQLQPMGCPSLPTQPGSLWPMGGPLQPPNQALRGRWEVLSRPANPHPCPVGPPDVGTGLFWWPVAIITGRTRVSPPPLPLPLCSSGGGRVHSGPHPRNLLLPGSIPPPPSTLGLVSPGRDRRTWGHPGCSQPRFGALRSGGGSPIRKPGCRDPPPRGREAQEGLKPGWVQDLARARGSGLIWGRGGHGEGMGGDRGGLPSPDSLSSKLFFN